MENYELKEGDFVLVTEGTHKGKSGFLIDRNLSKTGHWTIGVTQTYTMRFKTLAKNVERKQFTD